MKSLKSVVVGALAAVVVFGGIQVVSGVTDNKQIKACANKKSGVMRYTTKSCKKTERMLVFNSLGVPGVSGAKGDTGTKGDIGTAGTNGTAGAKGDTGVAGTNGTAGAAGTNGAGHGSACVVGINCVEGVFNLVGATGATGATGTNTTVKITELSICGADGATLCKVGVIGPGGGLIFFVDYDDQYAGFNYLEAAPADATFASAAVQGWWATTVAGCGTGLSTSCQTGTIYTETGATLIALQARHRGVGGGADATIRIVARHGATAANTYAAGVADAYESPTFRSSTKADWFLPSKGELTLMQANLNEAGVGGFAIAAYWSSSESAASNAWIQYATTGLYLSTLRDSNSGVAVRPVRSF